MKQMHLPILLVLLVASIVLVFLDSRRVLDPAKSVALAVTVPIQYSLYQTKLNVGEFFSFVTFWKSGEARIRNLELRNLELTAEKNRADSLERENNDLRKQLSAKALPAGRQVLPVTVVDVGQYLEIATGEFEGKTVVYLDNLVGKIVRPHFVQLPTDSQFKIPVRVGKVSGLAAGQFNNTIILDRVAQDEEIKVDDLVVTADEGLIVGKIKRIVSNKTDLFQRAEVTPLIDFGRLTTVFVLL